MTKSEAAAVASRASAAKRRTQREDEMIATLRSRGRLVECIATSPERAIAEETARGAINELEPTPDELRWMLAFLTTYAPRGVYEAVAACRNIYRPELPGWAVTPAQHDATCDVRVATLQEDGPHAGYLHCHFCNRFYRGVVPPPDPCKPTCSDPAAHAEGGHDV